MKASVKIVVLSALLFSQNVLAIPPLWELAYEETQLNSGPSSPSGQIDGQQNIALGFNFPFAGNLYNRISVDSDGGIILTNANAVANIAPTTWNKAFFQTNFSNLGQGVTAVPVIFPFNTSLSQLFTGGEVWFANYSGSFAGFTGDRAVVTWERSSLSPGFDGTPEITFQVILLGNGTIIFGYETLTSPSTWNNMGVSEQGIVVGISNGDGIWPNGSQNFTGPDFGIDLMGYEVWCFTDDTNNPSTCVQSQLGQNIDFDLHDKNVVFNPDGTSGFLVSSTIKNGNGGGGSGVCAIFAESGGGMANVGASGGSGGGGGFGLASLCFLVFLLFVPPLRRRNQEISGSIGK